MDRSQKTYQEPVDESSDRRAPQTVLTKTDSFAIKCGPGRTKPGEAGDRAPASVQHLRSKQADPAPDDAGKEVSRMPWYPVSRKGPFSPFPTLLIVEPNRAGLMARPFLLDR